MPLSRNQKLVLAAGVVAAVVVAAALLYYHFYIRGRGRILSVEFKVFKNPGLTQEIQVIDWGDCRPGEVKEATTYVKNVGNMNFTLELSAKNWDPPEASVLVLSSDYAGQIIPPGGALRVVLTLGIPSNITGVTDFEFDIVYTSREGQE